ncbi:DUF3828 domain-containing protein [Paraburkholderia ferrariae]|uniref:DUF3828 domain-containing protein n=1 Tax=Paraburkholderia ferrariae TaxID=386056 RepID=UPI00047FE610|nr:DUF3828 domain-containing protein [Paraburkholderia ferrariae]
MKRFFLFIVALVIGSSSLFASAANSAPPAEPQTQVQAFYAWYIKLNSRGDYPLLDKKIYAYVSRATVDHLRAAYVHDSLPGDSDYFLKVQDYDDQDWLSHIVTASPSREGQYVVVPVTFGSTDQVRVRVCVVKEGGAWKVVKVENGKR